MFHTLLQLSAQFGLHVNVQKCKQWCPVSTLSSPVVPAVAPQAGVKVLGIPIGSRSFIKEETSVVLSKLQQCLDRLTQLGCSFSAFHILRACLSACRVMHLLRSLPFAHAEQLAKETQAKLHDAFGHILGTPASVQQWALATLPVRMGGLGLLDPCRIVAPAHVSSFVASSVATSENGLTPCPISHEFMKALAHLDASSPVLSSTLRSCVTIGQVLDPMLSSHPSFESWSDQHVWTELVHEFSCNLLAETLPPRMRKMRELSSGAHAGLWLLSPLPQQPCVQWASADGQAILRWRLGVAQNLPPKCVKCGCSQDPLGDHSLCCTALGIYTRHNAVRDVLASSLNSLGFSCRTEVQLPGTSLVPADIFIPRLAEDSPTAVDVSVVHPLQPSNVAQATVTAGSAAELRAVQKVATYEEQCRLRS